MLITVVTVADHIIK